MKKLLVFLTFLLVSMTAFAQQPGNLISVSFDDKAPAPQGARVIQYNLPDGASKGWLDGGVGRNTLTYPEVRFLPNPPKDGANSLVASSESPRFFQGFRDMTGNTPASRLSAAGSYGGLWDITRGQNAPAAATEKASHPINSNTLYLNTFYEDGGLGSQRYDPYSRQNQDARYSGTGYYFGSLLKSLDSKGRAVTSALHYVGGLAQKTAKFY